MIKKIGYKSKVASTANVIKEAEKIILPGVGSFDSGVENLKKFDLWDALNERVLIDKIPVLGICLGAQLICNGSEEGNLKGLGWIDADVKKFNFDDKNYKIPHIGWNYIQLQNSKGKLFTDMYENPKFYFVHSYYIDVKDDSCLSKTNYGFDFDSSLEKDRILGVQFHPEKSHKFGMKLLKNFIEFY